MIDEKTLEGWAAGRAAGGLRVGEEELADDSDALHELRNDPIKLQENVKQGGVRANKVDASFYKVTPRFKELDGAEINAVRNFPNFKLPNISMNGEVSGR